MAGQDSSSVEERTIRAPGVLRLGVRAASAAGAGRISRLAAAVRGRMTEGAGQDCPARG